MRSIEFSFTDTVGIVASPFTGQVQAQQWPGADMWTATLTLPPLTQAQARQWIAALMQMRGMANAIQIGDPLGRTPAGSVLGTPTVDNSVTNGNAAMSQTLGTAGWTASQFGVLLRGDYIQVGYRLHRVLDDINTDGSGKALIPIWPSLREIPTNGSAVGTSNTAGLFRLAQNKRTWSSDYTKLSHLSFQLTEYR
jgi:hypothetical protein